MGDNYKEKLRSYQKNFRHSQRLKDKGQRVKWFEIGGSLEASLVPLEGCEKSKHVSQIQRHDISDLDGKINGFDWPVHTITQEQIIRDPIHDDANLDHKCSQDIIDRPIGLSVKRRKLRSCSGMVNARHDEDRFNFLAKPKVPRKLRSNLHRKGVHHVWLSASQVPAHRELHRNQAIGNPRDCLYAAEQPFLWDAATHSTTSRASGLKTAMAYCHNELDGSQNTAIPVDKTKLFRQSSLLSGNGYSPLGTKVNCFKHRQMLCDALLHSDGLSPPITSRLSSGSASENANLALNVHRRRVDDFSSVASTNYSSVTNPQFHLHPQACEKDDGITCRESQMLENYPPNSIFDFTFPLPYPPLQMLPQSDGNHPKSTEGCSSMLDLLCSQEIAAQSLRVPEHIHPISNHFHPLAGPPLLSSGVEMMGMQAHVQQDTRIDDMNGGCLGSQPLTGQQPSESSFDRSRNGLMNYPSGQFSQIERINPSSMQLGSHTHAQSPPQSNNRKETPSQSFASSYQSTQTTPMSLSGSGIAQPSGSIPQCSPPNTQDKTLSETPTVSAGSAPDGRPAKSLREKSQGTRGCHIDLNEIPSVSLKSKPKKHRPRVARDKPPCSIRTPKKSSVKRSDFIPKPQNPEGTSLSTNYETRMDSLQQFRTNSLSPRNTCLSNAQLNSMVQQVTSLPCNMMASHPRRPRTVHKNKMQRSDEVLEPEEDLLLLKETSSHRCSSQVTFGIQQGGDHAKQLTSDMNAETSIKGRLDNGKQKNPLKSKEKAQGASANDSNTRKVAWQSALINYETGLSPNILNSQEEQFIDGSTARDHEKQAYKRSSKFSRTGSKRKLKNAVQLNLAYENSNPLIYSNSRFSSIKTLSPSFPSLLLSWRATDCINCTESIGNGMSMTFDSCTDKNLPKSSQKIRTSRKVHSQTGETCLPLVSVADFSSSCSASDFIHNLVSCFQLLQLDEVSRPSKNLEIVPYSNPVTTLVPYEGPFNPLPRKKLRPKVMLDVETSRVWNLLMGKDCDKEHIPQSQGEIGKEWAERRTAMKVKVDLFISRMHDVQGDRKFSLWKGSIVDSVVGAFLTQNVSDHLSSSAFMALAAKYPTKKGVPAVNGTEWNVYEDYEQHGAVSYVLDEKSLSGECRNGEIDVFAVSCPITRNHRNFECYSPSYESGGTKSPSKERDSRFTPGSSESVVQELSPCDKCCNAESPTYPNPLSIDETYSSEKFASSKEKDSLLDCEGENNVFRIIEKSKKSSYCLSKAQNVCGPVRRQLFKEIEKASQVVEDNASCITESSSKEDLKEPERLFLEEKAGTEELNYRNSCENYDQLENCCPTREIASEKGDSEILHNMEGIHSVSCHLEKQLKEGEVSCGVQTGCAGSCVTCSNPIQRKNCVNENPEAENLDHNHLACDGALSKEHAVFSMSDNTPLTSQDAPCCHTLATCKAHESLTYKLPDESRKSIITNEKNAVVPGAEKIFSAKLSGVERAKMEQSQGGSKDSFDWESLRQKVEATKNHGDALSEHSPESDTLPQDGVDWEAVRLADVEDVAEVIKERGMNNVLAGRIKAFLARLHSDHGNINLEWLRMLPVEDAKKFLLSIRGLGLKSVECIRLLTLQHLAFPVDTNVGRICVRLGWVPIEPLPEELQLHLLELYPIQATIQKYLWPHLCTLDQRTLYELHYQMITFGKVFCTKSRPNCNACPMKGDCKHFSSAYASAKLALPAPEQKDWKDTTTLTLPPPEENAVRENTSILALLPPDDKTFSQHFSTFSERVMLALEDLRKSCEPIIEEPASPEPLDLESLSPLMEQPSSPCLDDNYIVISDQPELELSRVNEGRHSQLQQVTSATSKALILMSPDTATIPVPKLKNVGRLRTVHYVYELPDDHELLAEMDPREADDPCFYLFAIWSPGETLESPPGLDHNREVNHAGCNSVAASEETVNGILLVPCRTAMRGNFPLNGTYFQVNEVFADHESSINPIEVKRSLLWSLQRRFVYFGTSVPSIFRGLTRDEIKACFWKGYVCVRGFDRHQRAPKPLAARLHLPMHKRTINKKKDHRNGQDKPL